MIIITVLMMRNTHVSCNDTDNIVGCILTRVTITTMIMMMMFAIAEIPWNRFCTGWKQLPV